MQAYTLQHGVVMPLDRANVNTDDIIPAQYLTVVSRTGFAHGLFSHWRYQDGSREPNLNFVLNQPRYKDATILVSRENFGCGSSREHAPWALLEYGFRTIIAPTFADIFYNNCLNTGILPLRLDAEIVQRLFTEIEAHEDYTLTVDLAAQTVTTPGGECLPFAIDAFRKDALLQGLDAVGRTLKQADQIAAFERRKVDAMPWDAELVS